MIVNRVWARHFGRGLVDTPSNFGALGERPDAPRTARLPRRRFVKNGWSLKWLHRQIMLVDDVPTRQPTPTRRTTRSTPANVYLWRATAARLDVEAWRDALLRVSGNLDPTLGGPTFDLNDAQRARGARSTRKVSRHDLDGLLRLFDFPDANVTADKRTRHDRAAAAAVRR